MRRHRRSFVLVAAALFAAVAQPHAQTVESPGSAPFLLKQMEAAYARLQSYSDNSVVFYRNPDGSERSRVEFKIWFARPAAFRIDAQTTRADGGQVRREVMWSDGEKARTWSSDKPVVNLDKIQIAGSRMFGTYAYHVPTLLEASYGGKKRIHELGSPTLAGTEVIDGVDCDRIRGDFHGDPYELWVGKTDHLVRKIVATYRGNQMEEIHREISTNQPIALSVFKFAPENEALPPPAKKEPSPSSPAPAGKKPTPR
jgi:outer membrane lipoprotein-sorting protein